MPTPESNKDSVNDWYEHWRTTITSVLRWTLYLFTVIAVALVLVLIVILEPAPP